MTISQNKQSIIDPTEMQKPKQLSATLLFYYFTPWTVRIFRACLVSWKKKVLFFLFSFSVGPTTKK